MNEQVEIYLKQAFQFHTSLLDELDETIQKMPTHTIRGKRNIFELSWNHERLWRNQDQRRIEFVLISIDQVSKKNSEDEYSNIDLISLTSLIWMLNGWVTGWRWQMNIIYSLTHTPSRITTYFVNLLFEHNYIRYCYSWQWNLFLIFHCVISQ